MKKLLTILIVTLLIGISGISQTSNLPNGNLNDWYFAVHTTHEGGGFYEPGGGFFSTLNILDTIATPPGLTCFRSDEVHSGTYAARLLTQQIDILQILIPGVIGTLSLNWAVLNATLGVPYTYVSRAKSFQGWYKSTPLNGDSAGALITLSKWNPITHQRDIIGSKQLVFKGTVSDYTFFDADIVYQDPTTQPDSITILLLSSAGYNTANMMGSVGRVGSQAWFDDVTITDVNGFHYQLMPEVGVKLFPNPTSSVLIVELEKEIKDAQFIISSLEGKDLYTTPLSQVRNQVSVTSLHPGNYYYKVSDGKTILNSGSFIIAR
jgi:hypothetical protein